MADGTSRHPTSSHKRRRLIRPLLLLAAVLACACKAPPGAQPVDGAAKGPDAGGRKVPDNTVWAVVLGGPGTSRGFGLTVDPAGNVYVAGTFTEVIRLGTTTLSSKGHGDLFLAKLNPQGKVLWARSAGGLWGNESASTVGLDSKGNIFIMGSFSGTVRFGSTTLGDPAIGGLFVSKLDPLGNFLWITPVTATQGERYVSGAMALEPGGDTYLAGSFDGPIRLGSTTLAAQKSQRDMFLASLDSTGHFRWARAVGGKNSDVDSCGIALEPAGGIRVTGSFRGAFSFGSTSLSSMGSRDTFVASLDRSGHPRWAISAGGTGYTTAYHIIVDATGHSILSGVFDGKVQFGSTTLKTAQYDYTEFVARLDSAGRFVWARPLFQALDGITYTLNVGRGGSAVQGGFFRGPVSLGSLSLVEKGEKGGNWSAFVAEVDSQGRYQWATTAGRKDGSVDIYDLFVDSNGTIYATGTTSGTANGPLSFGDTWVMPNSNNVDILVWKLRGPSK